MSYLIFRNNLFNFSMSNDTSVSAQVINQTVSAINGTNASFTPTIQTQHIIYECFFQFNYQPDTNSGLYIELFEDQGSGFSGLGNNFCVTELGNNVAFENVSSLKFLIPYYTGTRTYELRARTYDNNFETSIHTNVNNDIMYPVVSMYSLL
tara:strand:- start:502 stop:954 length:453 start_codon:yes stop_codon:yes gene_type:complete